MHLALDQAEKPASNGCKRPADPRRPARTVTPQGRHHTALLRRCYVAEREVPVENLAERRPIEEHRGRGAFARRLDAWTETFRALKVPVLPISTATPPADQLRELFGRQTVA